jgi:hypothetical protein
MRRGLRQFQSRQQHDRRKRQPCLRDVRAKESLLRQPVTSPHADLWPGKGGDHATGYDPRDSAAGELRPGDLGRGEAVVIAETLPGADQQVSEDEYREALQVQARCGHGAADNADAGADHKTVAAADASHQKRRRQRGDRSPDHHRRDRRCGHPLVRRHGGAKNSGQRHGQHDRRQRKRLTGGEQ